MTAIPTHQHSRPALDQEPAGRLHRQCPGRLGRPGGQRRRHRRGPCRRPAAFGAVPGDVRRRQPRPAAGPDQHTPPLLPDPHPRLGSGGERPAVPLAAEPVSGVGAAHAEGPRTGHHRCAGRTPALRLHHRGGPPLPFPGRPGTRDRRGGGRGPPAGDAGHPDARFHDAGNGRRRPAAAVDGAGSGGGAGGQRTADRPVPRARRRRRHPDCAGPLLAVLGDQGDHGRKRR